MSIQSKLPDVGTTIFSRMTALAQECAALNLSQGFPEYPAPLALREAFARHAMEGHNQYAPMIGLPALREQICAQLERYRGEYCDPDTEITVVPGATEAIFCAIMACIGADDEVILLDPCYDSYAPAITLAGGRAVHVPLAEDSFAIDWERVADAISSRTRMIVINSPHNPSGSMLSLEDMRELEEVAQLHNLLVVSDEVYEHLVFDGRQHHSVLQFPGLRERSFAVFSFGKTYGVTGWKTGYCVAPPALTFELRKVHQYVCFVAVTPVQQALAEFMRDDPDYPATLASVYQGKRDLLCDALSGSRLSLTPSAGSFFQILDYGAVCQDPDTQVCEHWTRQLGLATIPLSPFYQAPPHQFRLRLCFAKTDEQLRRAAEILCKI